MATREWDGLEPEVSFCYHGAKTKSGISRGLVCLGRTHLQEVAVSKTVFMAPYMFLPPVTMMTCPVMYPNSGLATARMLFAASVAVPGLPSGMSA